MDKVNLEQKLAMFSDHWSPKSIATINDYEVKLVKVQGEFVWHSHQDTDEMFLVLDGELTVRLRDRSVVLLPGELFVVPRGVEHQPYAEQETSVVLLEPIGVVNTGTAGGEMTSGVTQL